MGCVGTRYTMKNDVSEARQYLKLVVFKYCTVINIETCEALIFNAAARVLRSGECRANLPSFRSLPAFGADWSLRMCLLGPTSLSV